MHGHITKKDGNWYVVLEHDRVGREQRKRRWISVRKELGLNKPATKTQAQALLVQKLRELQTGTYVEPNDMTVAQLMDKWLEVYARPNLRETTYSTHLAYINNHIKPEIGYIQLSKLRPLHLQQLYAKKLKGGRADGGEGGLSGNSIRYIHKLLNKALAAAVTWELVARNVAEAATPPKISAPERQAWTAEQVNRYLRHIKEHRLYPLYYLALSTGMRRGELLGLRWQDIHWDDKSLSVNQSLVVAGGKIRISSTKTESSRRSISLSPTELSTLRAHRKRQLEEMMILGVSNWSQELVFVSEVGTPLNPRNLLRQFQTTSKQAGVPIIPFHALRHTCATLMLQSGIHPKVVAERLGHSRISTTLDIYSHVMPNMQMEAALALENMLKTI